MDAYLLQYFLFPGILISNQILFKYALSIDRLRVFNINVNTKQIRSKSLCHLLKMLNIRKDR